MLVKILLFTIICMMLIVPGTYARASSTNGNQPLTFVTTDRNYTAGVVEQQSVSYPNCDPLTQQCVENNTGCLWTADSWEIQQSFGYLTTGSSTTASDCYIADWQVHQFKVDIKANSPNLLVKVALSPAGGPFTVTSVALSKGSGYSYEYLLCFYLAGYGRDYSGFQPISNSNGGVGVPSSFQVTVSNPTGQKIRGIFAWMRFENYFSC
jgi:hypothetical protein